MSNTLGFGLDVNRGGAGYKYQSETVTLLRALTGTYSTPRKIQIDKLIKSLKTAGVWAKLDVLQMYAAPTAADAVINWKNPGTFNATLVNSPTLEADRGITGDGASSYINTAFNPSAGTNYTLNSSLFAIYSRTDSQSTARNGVIFGSNSTNSIIRNTSDVFLQYVNTNAASTGKTNANSLGLHGSQRNSNTETEFFKNGASLGTESQNSSALPNGNFFVGARNVDGSAANFGTRQFSLFLAGTKLTAGEHSSLFTAVETYLDYIGAGVI